MKKKQLFLLIFIGSFFLYGCSSTSNVDLRLYDSPGNDYQQLAQEYQQKITTNPEDENSRYLLAFFHYKLGNFDRASLELQELIKNAPFTAKYYSLLGQINFERKSYIAAQQNFTFAIRYQNSLLDAYFGLARTLEEVQKYAEAKQVVDNGLLIASENSFDLRLLSIRLERKLSKTTSKHLELIQELKQLLQIQPYNPTAALTMADLLTEIDRQQNAADYLSNWVERYGQTDEIVEALCSLYTATKQPDYASALIKQAEFYSINLMRCEMEVHFIEKQPQKARDVFEQHKTEFYDRKNMNYVEANLLIQEKKHSQALKILEQMSFEFEYLDFQLNYLSAQIYFQKKDYQKAGVALERSLRQTPNNLAAKLLNIRWLLAVGRVEEAYINFFAENFDPNNPAILEIEGDIYQAQNNFTQAEKMYRLSIILEYRASVVFKLAQLLFSKGQTKEAFGMLENFYNSNQKNFEGAFELAKQYFYQQNFKKFIALMEPFYQEQQEADVDFYLLYAISLNELGKTDTAMQILKQTAVKNPYSILLIDQLTSILIKQNKNYEAIPYLEFLLSNNQPEANYLFERLANAYTKVKEYKLANEARKKYFQ